MTSWLRIGIAACAVFAPSTAFSANSTLTMGATVPVVCRAQLTVSSPGVIQGTLGMIDELCNSPQGYRLTVIYNVATLQGASVTVGTDSIVLDGTGTAVISTVSSAAVRQRVVAVANAASPVQPSDIAFSITPS